MNTIIYAFLTFFSILILLLTFIFKKKGAVYVAGCCHCCGCVAQFICLVITVVYRFASAGRLCAENETNFEEVDWRFEEHGETLQTLIIV